MSKINSMDCVISMLDQADRATVIHSCTVRRKDINVVHQC